MSYTLGAALLREEVLCSCQILGEAIDSQWDTGQLPTEPPAIELFLFVSVRALLRVAVGLPLE